jgi:hypothetical protein
MQKVAAFEPPTRLLVKSGRSDSAPIVSRKLPQPLLSQFDPTLTGVVKKRTAHIGFILGAFQFLAGSFGKTADELPTVQPSLRDLMSYRVGPGDKYSAQYKSCTAERVPPGYFRCVPAGLNLKYKGTFANNEMRRFFSLLKTNPG